MNDPSACDQLRRYWREHIDACHDSGETGAAYCWLHQLVYHRFSYWHRKFRDEDNHAQLTLSESTGFAQILLSRKKI